MVRSRTMFTLGSWTLLLGFLVGMADTRWCGPNRVSIGNHFDYCIGVKECVRRGFLVYGRRCVHSCPIGTYYHQGTQTCNKQCPRHTILIGTECLNGTYCKSKHNQVLFNGTCLAMCPSSMPFQKEGTCYRTCPSNTVVNGTECLFLEDCKKNGFVNGISCVAQCPPEHKYTLQGVCHRSCPPSVAVSGNGTSCFTKEYCTVKLRRVIFNNSCVAACPQEAPYSDHSTCFSECPTAKFLLGDKCVSAEECWQRNMSLYHNACIAYCPVAAPFLVDHYCHSNCPENTVFLNGSCINERDCLSPSGRYMVIFNGTCVDKCPLEAPINNEGSCVSTCPNTRVVSDMQCVDISDCLESNNYISNGTCVSKCPQTSPYVSHRRCYQSCPEGSVISEPGSRLCIGEPQCTSFNKVYNNTCLTACPLQSQYIYSSRCYSLCPLKTVSLPSRLCIPAFDCKVQRKYIQETECLDTCSPTFPYTMDNTCYSVCPSNSSLFPGNRCVTVANCRFESNAVIYNGTCLPSCPRSVPYKHDGKCLSKCPGGSLTKGHDCIHPKSCPPDVIYNGTCLPSCPRGAPYKHGGKCVTSCPGGMVIKGFTCESYCLNKYIYNGICISSCPTDAPYTTIPDLHSLGYTCHSVCPKDWVLNGSNCVMEFTCKFSGSYFIYNGSCVTECPPGASTFVRGVCYDENIDQYAIKMIPALILVMLVLLYCLVHNPKNLKGKDITPMRPGNQKLLDAEDEDNYADLLTEPSQDQETLHGPDPGEACSEVLIEMDDVPNDNPPMAEGGINDAIVQHHRDQDDVPLLLDDNSLIQLEEVDQHHLINDALLFGDGNNG
ncbi:proprotein convertase subtilisin/kexin type 5-like [Haliotis rubra]|uniref:proprotein convertase subtilisin/kexin type 5-like n=1 Tax=Haliotis rubra TaxID=36100 RepID=UPI001EE5F8C5|nr:proprotein convertase subtilisin/kexin type 5-like [Haliotis rubra]